MEPLNIAWLRNAISDLPDDALVIVNGGQGNKNTIWSAEPKEDEEGNEILEIMY
jgi:hypothetical protein